MTIFREYFPIFPKVFYIATLSIGRSSPGSPAYGESEQMLRVSLYCSQGEEEEGSVYSVSLENNNHLHLNSWTRETSTK